MRQNGLRLGTLHLLFAVILSFTALLAVLSVMTVRADSITTQKYAQNISARYAHEAEVTSWLAGFDEALRQGGALPAPAAQDGDTVTAAFSWEDGTEINLTLRLQGSGKERTWSVTAWKTGEAWQQDTGVGTLWGGPIA